MNLAGFKQIGKLFSSGVKVAKKNAPQIMTTVGAIGMIVTTCLAVKETPKAIKAVEEAKEQKGEELTKMEVIKAGYKPYLIPIGTGIVSTGLIFGGQYIGVKTLLSTAATAKMFENELVQYKSAAKDILSDKNEKKLNDKVNEYKLTANPPSDDNTYVKDPNGYLFFDRLSARYIRCKESDIRDAIGKTNILMANKMEPHASVNDFYEELGMPTCELGTNIGWSFETGGLDFVPTPARAFNGEPCFIIDFVKDPYYDDRIFY